LEWEEVERGAAPVVETVGVERVGKREEKVAGERVAAADRAATRA
jgi:hypothetical protein